MNAIATRTTAPIRAATPANRQPSRKAALGRRLRAAWTSAKSHILTLYNSRPLIFLTLVFITVVGALLLRILSGPDATVVWIGLAVIILGATLDTWDRFPKPAKVGATERIVDGRRPLVNSDELLKIAGARPRSESPKFGFGGVRLPIDTLRLGTAYMGVPGSGKTTQLKRLMCDVLPTIRDDGNRKALIYDVKGELGSYVRSLRDAGHVTCPVMTLDPFDSHAWAWDMAADVDTPSRAMDVAALLIPDGSGKDQEYFQKGARLLIAGVMQSLMQQKPREWTLRDLLLVLGDPNLLNAMLRRSAAGRRTLRSVHAGPGTGYAGLLSTIAVHTQLLSPIAALWDRLPSTRKVSLTDWAQNGRGVLVLGSTNDNSVAMKALNATIFHVLTKALMPRGLDNVAGVRTFVLVDEAASAGYLDVLPDLLARGRGYGIATVLTCQNIDGLFEAFGRDRTLSMLGQLSQFVLMRLATQESQKWASVILGETEVQELRTTYNKLNEVTSRQWHQRVRPVVLPTKLGDLRPHHAYYVSADLGCVWLATLRTLPPTFPPQEISSPPPEAQNLRSWTDEELRSFGLSRRDMEQDRGSDQQRHGRPNRKPPRNGRRERQSEPPHSRATPSQHL